MKKSNLAVIIAVVICTAVAGIIALNNPDPAAPTACFTISRISWLAYETLQIGVEHGEAAGGAHKTTFCPVDDINSSLRDFKDDRFDAVTLTIYEAILMASRGMPIKIVLLLDYTIGSDGLVARKEIGHITELSGKRIGVEMGTISHFTVLKALEKSGLCGKDVELVNFNDPHELQRAFIHGKVDAVGTFEPYLSNLTNQADGHIIFSSLEIPRSICDVLFVKESVARDHPDTIDHWILAWNRALNYKSNKPNAYLQSLNRLSGTPIPELKESFKGIFFTSLAENRMAFGTRENPGYLVESLKEMESFMLKEGVIDQKVPLMELIDFSGVNRYFER
jgi:NitT/TauT family transport system substrate-binding protein